MRQLQALGEFAYARIIAGRKPFNGQQRLMLLRSQTHRCSGLFAEAKKAPQRVAESG